MDLAILASAPLILINLLFAGIALAVGFAAGAWFLGGGKPTPITQDEDGEADAAIEKHLAVERAMLATGRLKDLASGVAADVGEHSNLVEKITADLLAVKGASAEQQTAEVASALSRIVEANGDLQARLAKAEQQIQTQAEEIRAHESEARTDSLTKLANRRSFDDHLAQRYAEWQRKATPFAMIILDVDHFKKFNDTHGHQAGDEVLRHVSAAIQETVREMDLPCRYGGEEFAVILPATIARDALGLVERLRKAIEKRSIEFEGKVLNVTASFGLAEITHSDSEAGLLKRADDALYAAKDAGRNRGYLHDGENCVPVIGAEKDAPAKAAASRGRAVPTKTLGQLPNRTLFAEEVRRRIAESSRSQAPLSIITVEFAAYDQINQEYGEEVALLTFDSVADFLRSTLREMDLLGRLSDGRLAAMLPTATAENAQAVADRVTAALAKCSVPLGDGSTPLITTTGVAELRTGDSAASLIGRATAAMESLEPAAPAAQIA